MTGIGVILGTAAYMSPEQARGKTVDKRADVWAFGVVFYEMVTGRRPFAGDDVSEVLASVLAREPDWSQLPGELPPTVVAVSSGAAFTRMRNAASATSATCCWRSKVRSTRRRPRRRAPVPAQPPRWKRVVQIAAAALVAAAATGLLMWAQRPWRRPHRRSHGSTSFSLRSQELRGPQRSVVAVAPDGRAFVYRAADGLYLRSLGDLEPRLIPGIVGRRTACRACCEGRRSPRRSSLRTASGSAISREDGLKKIGIAGGTPVTIASSPSASSCLRAGFLRCQLVD